MAAEEVVFDVVEKILVRLDVKDIIRCKSVCKSWQSFISSPEFVKSHLRHAYKNDHDRDKIGHRRIGISQLFSNHEISLCANFMYMVGSCNGLVCISIRDAEIKVVNPSTRERRKLRTPDYQPVERLVTIRQVACLGFGYDASTDDYKVIAGFRDWVFEERTLFHVLTLKSSIWKVIGEVKYKNLSNRPGVLCGGALHYFMYAGKKKVIMSLDLSTEEFKEIPQPLQVEYDNAEDFFNQRLGVIVDEEDNECLCIYSFSSSLFGKKWVMKNNKWEPYNERRKYDIAHFFSSRRLVDSQNRTSFIYVHDYGRLVPSDGYSIGASLFVRSLVSPHPPGQPKELLEDSDDARSNTPKRKRKRKKFCKHKRALLS
ncbi:hypothetical protein E3N88_36874 [Mikania micrantha]|uniref:F-box domain-containing protein n=1 Tax=Mikania micrantha TaxID=192012 RepID=A0A5N6M4W0_9ASTR|nr:hypothetical protein E3N88_36874 [Mikania micrantha]